MGTQKTPLQKTYEINADQDSIDVEFLGTNRQFDWTKYLWYTTKVINTQQYTIPKTVKWLPKA